MITLHHLTFSRSIRVIWLLEELSLNYRLIIHERDAHLRAPASLKAVHALGKAPVINDGGLVIAESSAILRHIDKHHGGSRFSPSPEGVGGTVHDEWLQYSESSAAMPILLNLIGNMVGGLTPGLLAFVNPELEKTMDYIASALTPGPYLIGDSLTLADIQLSYLLWIANAHGITGNRPAIRNYLARLEARPAQIKAVRIGGPIVHPPIK